MVNDREMRWLLVPAAGLVGALALSFGTDARADTQREVPLARAIVVEPGATCLDEAARRGAGSYVARTRHRARQDTRVTVHGDPRNPRERWSSKSRGEALVRRRKFDETPSGCDETHAAVGLAIALAIDAGVLKQLLEPANERPVRLLAVQLGGGYEVLPAFSFGAKASVEYGIREWLSGRGRSARGVLPRDGIAGSSGTFDAALLVGSLEICAGGRLVDMLRVALCAGAGAGGVRAQGHGYTVSRAEGSPWLGVLSGVRVDILLGLRWVLDLDMAVPVVAPRYTVELPHGGDLSREHKESRDC